MTQELKIVEQNIKNLEDVKNKIDILKEQLKLRTNRNTTTRNEFILSERYSIATNYLDRAIIQIKAEHKRQKEIAKRLKKEKT